jgi:hypothetical protein
MRGRGVVDHLRGDARARGGCEVLLRWFKERFRTVDEVVAFLNKGEGRMIQVMVLAEEEHSRFAVIYKAEERISALVED